MPSSESPVGTVFFLEGTAQNTSEIISWRKPSWASLVSILLVGRGGDGGLGFTRGSGLTKGGGGGGGPGGAITGFFAASLLPDVLFFYLPGRSASVKTAYAFYGLPDSSFAFGTDVNLGPVLLLSTGGTNGSAGTSSAGGSVGAAGNGSYQKSIVPLIWPSLTGLSIGGASGATTTGNSVSLAASSIVTGGAGGGGGTTGTGTANGGGIISPGGVNQMLTNPGAGPSVNPAASGLSFFLPNSVAPIGFFGGNGGGANLGSGAGAAGGNGAPGCGGGGGGAGVTSGGAGGLGGPGFLVICCTKG